jgi:hypothetical protein
MVLLRTAVYLHLEFARVVIPPPLSVSDVKRALSLEC